MSNSSQHPKRSSPTNGSSPLHAKNKKEKQVPTLAPRRLSSSAPNTPLSKRHTSSKAKQYERIREITDSPKSGFASKKASKRASMIVNDSKRQELHTKRHQRSNSAMDSIVYAGPVFNNSPAPDTLPVPSFVPAETVQSSSSSTSMTTLSTSTSTEIPPTSTSHFSFSLKELDLAEIRKNLISLLKL